MVAGKGKCSYYGSGFLGNLTANGEIFNKNGMTAAHLTLPFGTRLMVTNRNNGRTVVVRINDRGPHVSGRVLNLTEAAFARVESLSTGDFECTYTTI